MDFYNEKILSLLQIEETNFSNSAKGKEVKQWCKENFYPINSIYFDSYFLLNFYNQESGRTVILDEENGTAYPDYKGLLNYWIDERIKRMDNIIEANRIADNWENIKKQIQKDNASWFSNLLPDFKTYLYIGLGIAGIILFNKLTGDKK